MTLQDAKQGWEFLFLPEEYGIKAKIWNPITGCPKLAERNPCACPDGTPYCYMDALIKRFPKVHSGEYRFHHDRLNQINRKKPCLIGVGTSGDMWGWMIANEMKQVLLKIFDNPQHFYLFLTKFPLNYPIDYLPNFCENFGVGTTVTQPNDLWRIESLNNVNAPMRYVVFEPLFGDWRGIDLSVLHGIDWIIIGSVTGLQNNSKHYPKYDQIKPLLDKIQELKIPTFFKNNFQLIDYPTTKEFPPQIFKLAEKAT